MRERVKRIKQMKMISLIKVGAIAWMMFQPLVARQPGVAKSVNMGPTGIRVLITKEQPFYFKVAKVEANSPADGLLNVNELICIN